MRLDGKRILITGGGSGIGLELARRLADTNQVVIAGRDEAKLERARAETPRLHALTLDVTSDEEAQRAVDWLSTELGGLDPLVNNAGLLRGYELSAPEAEDKSVEDVDVNVTGSIRMTRLALPLLEASRGAVLFMSSAVALAAVPLAAVPGFAVYAATKAAVHSLARSLRAELKGSGIRVFEVVPPVVGTGPVERLDVPKIAPSVVVDAILRGVARDRKEIRIGPVKQLAPLARLTPRLADRIVVRALRRSASATR